VALANKGFFGIYNGLIHKFLYNSDINSIHILLNLCDLEDNITNISPKYISIHKIKKHINRFLKNKKGNHFISLNLGQLIHDDINRLELYIYIEGYRNGYFNNQFVNRLEKLSIESIPLEDLYKRKYLYHFKQNPPQVKSLQEIIFNELSKKEKKSKKLYENIKEYSDDVMKRKVLSLNKYLDKQLTIECDIRHYTIKEDYSLLTLEELNRIYDEVFKMVFRSGLKLYKEAYWYGVNDRVLKRYR